MTTTRQQILRSSTPGQVPAAGTRQPGELWTTFPDLQLGVIDASKNAQKMIAVRFFSTTANYVAGDFVIQAGVLYAAKGAVAAGAFNATQWTQIAASTDANGPYLPIAGGTLTGALTLNADPGAALGAATKQYVDGKVTAAPFLPLAGGTMLAPITLSGPPTIPLHAATKAYVDAGAFVPLAGGTMIGDLILNRDPQVALGAATRQYADTKYAATNPAGYQTAAQVTASLGNYLPLSGGTVTGPLNAAGGLVMTGTTPNLVWHYTDNSLLGEIGYQGSSTQGWNNAAATTWLYLWGDQSFSYFGGTGVAVKTGGGSWTAASDARIKTVEGEWKLGLDEVLKLEPVVYRYKGNDGEPGKASPHAHVAETEKAFVGLIAQAVETVFPNMVTKGKGWIDGAEVDDFRQLDPSTLVYALINAVKELSNRVVALEAQLASR